jgi:hypothetical protein
MRSTTGDTKIYAYSVDLGTSVETGATANNNQNINYLTYKQITGLTPGDTIRSVLFDIYSCTSTSFKGGVYEDNGSNLPGSILTNGGNPCSGELTNQTVATWDTLVVELDYTATVPANGTVWVAIVPNTTGPNLRGTIEAGSSYAHSVYQSGSPSGLYTNYVNMLFSSASNQTTGSINVRFGVKIASNTVTQGDADIYLEVAQ